MYLESYNRKNIKILYLISGDLWAGAEVVTFNLLKKLKNNKLTIKVVVLNEGKFAKVVNKIGIDTIILDENKLSFWEIFERLKSIVYYDSPDILHSHRYKENILAYLVSRRKNIKLLTTIHGMPEIYQAKNNVKYKIISKINFFILSKYFHRVISVSNNIKNILLESFGFNPEKITVIHNGIEIPKIISKEKNRNSFIIGSAGRLFPVKNYPLFIKIAKQLRNLSDKFYFELVGEGPEYYNLKKLVKTFKIEDSFFIKKFTDNMRDFYNGLDLYINTSFHEGIPLTILEAMSYGIPVVASNVGGINEIILNGVNGYLVDSKNPDDYLKICYNLFKDSTICKRIGTIGRKSIIDKFSSNNMTNQYLEVYHKLINTD
ncbi:MAG: glycosyltransferase family 4 protein [Promethearchaeota archaeon]